MLKILIVLVFLAIIASLASALYHLIKTKDEADSKKTVRALTLRISLSLILFIVLFFLMQTGALKPHGIGAAMQHARAMKQNSEASKP